MPINLSLINDAREVLESSQGDISSELADVLQWILALPPLIVFLLVLAVFFLCAVVILFFRDMLRLLKIYTHGTHIASQSSSVRIMNPGGIKKILIAGDSTAVGAGADTPEDTLMGMFAHDFPDIEIHNIAINGAITKQVITQLKNVEDEHFALAIISTGGNDVWRLTARRKLAQELNIVIQRALAISNNKVVLLLYSNIGSAPVFPIFIRDYLIRHGAEVNQMFREIAHHYHIQCVEVFTEQSENPFLRNPKEFFASDGIHPSSKGYRLWYNRLWRILITRNYDLHPQKVISASHTPAGAVSAESSPRL